MRFEVKEDQQLTNTAKQTGKVANAVNRSVRQKATRKLTALAGHQAEPNRGEGDDRRPRTPKAHVTSPRQWTTEEMTPERKAEAKSKAEYHHHLGAIAKLANVIHSAKKHERLAQRYKRIIGEKIDKKAMKRLLDASDQANNKTAAMYTNIGQFQQNPAFESVKLPYTLTVHYEQLKPGYRESVGNRYRQTSNHKTEASALKRLSLHHHLQKGYDATRIVGHEIKKNIQEAKNQNRETTGRYTLGMHHRCVCGHTLGEHGNPDIAPSKRACMHESGCNCAGFKKDKKQIFKEWVNEAREKHTHLGTCQACGRQQAHESNGKVAKHGYNVEHGYFHGTCPGSGHKPLEHSHEFTDYVIHHMHDQAKSAREQSEAARVGHHNPHIHSHDEDVMDEKTGKVKRDKYLGKVTKPVHKPYSESTNEARLRYHARMEHHARSSEAHARELEKLKKDVHGKPLTPAHHHPEAVAKRTAVKQARTANADKKREIQHLGHEFNKAHHELQKHYLALPQHERTEAKTHVYYGPQFHHWSAKHSEAAKKEFPAAHHIINHIDALAAKRKELTKKEERQMQVDTNVNLLDEGVRTLSPRDAHDILEKHGGAHADFFELASHHVHGLLQHAKALKYRKGKYAPGSTARMFHQALRHRAAHHKVTAEGRNSEFNANRSLSSSVNPRKPGHYLMKHGTPMHQQPHATSQAALDAYHKLPDREGVKIHHVKEDFTDGPSPLKSLAELSKSTHYAYQKAAGKDYWRHEKAHGIKKAVYGSDDWQVKGHRAVADKRNRGLMRSTLSTAGAPGYKTTNEIVMAVGSGDPGHTTNATDNFASQVDKWKKRFKLQIKSPMQRRLKPKMVGLPEALEATVRARLDDEGIPPEAISDVDQGVASPETLERRFHAVRDGQTKKLGPGGVDEGIKNSARFRLKKEHEHEHPVVMHGKILRATSQIHRLPSGESMIFVRPHTGPEETPSRHEYHVPVHHIERVKV